MGEQCADHRWSRSARTARIEIRQGFYGDVLDLSQSARTARIEMFQEPIGIADKAVSRSARIEISPCGVRQNADWAVVRKGSDDSLRRLDTVIL